MLLLLIAPIVATAIADTSIGGGMVQRLHHAIELIELSDGNWDESRQVIVDILHSVVQEVDEDRSMLSATRGRRLEDGRDSNDDDDYFSFYSLYSFTKHNSDVSVSYDDEDNTVVTVGDDVIVVVKYPFEHYLFNGMMVLACIALGATMAGLLMGVMSLDPLILGVKARTAENEAERRAARSLLPFVQNKNLVLVSVLLINCGTNEALPIFMDAVLESPFISVVLSLTVVLVVGEILPSAYFTGKDQVRSASNLIPVLRLVIIITSPISWPLAKLMDHYFNHGDEVASFKRGEISALVRIQYEEHLAWKRRQAEKIEREAMKDDISIKSLRTVPSFSKHCETCHNCNMYEPLSFLNESEFMTCVPHDQCIQSSNSTQQNICSDDIVKLEGALSLKDKRVENTYTPMHRVVSVTADAILDEDMVARIYSYGYSRLPVFGRDHATGQLSVCGILLTKQLMLVGKDDKRKVAHLTLYEPPCISPDSTLADTLSIILKGNRRSSNMALVCANPTLASSYLSRRHPVPVEAGVMGIITLEQVRARFPLFSCSLAVMHFADSLSSHAAIRRAHSRTNMG
jgi:metal transporter CNNM